MHQTHVVDINARLYKTFEVVSLCVLEVWTMLGLCLHGGVTFSKEAGNLVTPTYRHPACI